VRFIFLGPPAAGKGTQARRLAEERGLAHISTGDILRAAARAGTPLGQEAKRYTERGALVPDEVMIGIIRERLQQEDCRRGFILDGFPRTIPQAEVLSELLDSLGKPVEHVVNLDVPMEEVLLRVRGRLTCQNCGAMFNLMLDPPQVEGRCNRCGGPLVHRNDDGEALVRERLAIYHESTEPLVEYYRARGLLRTVDGTGTIDDIAKRIADVVDE
jgi:adenylate kinase